MREYIKECKYLMNFEMKYMKEYFVGDFYKVRKIGVYKKIMMLIES